MAYNLASMPVTVRSFAKINLGLHIGGLREDGFHELLTVYQTIGLHDVIRVSVGRGSLRTSSERARSQRCGGNDSTKVLTRW